MERKKKIKQVIIKHKYIYNICFYIVNKYENQKLIEACRKGDIEKIQISIQNGANINCKDNNYGYTPLLCAVIKVNIYYVLINLKKIFIKRDIWRQLKL